MSFLAHVLDSMACQNSTLFASQSALPTRHHPSLSLKPRSESEDFVTHSEPINTFNPTLSLQLTSHKNTPFRTTGDLHHGVQTRGEGSSRDRRFLLVPDMYTSIANHPSDLFLHPQIPFVVRSTFPVCFLQNQQRGGRATNKEVEKVWVCGRDWGWCGGLEEVYLRSVVGVLE